MPAIETCFNCFGTRSSDANERIKTTVKCKVQYNKMPGNKNNYSPGDRLSTEQSPQFADQFDMYLYQSQVKKQTN